MPAAFCGIVGLKPTYGLVPGEGEIPCPCTLASIGPMTRTVRDAALVLRAIADEPMSDDELSALDRGVRGLRIAVPAAQASQALDAEVAAAVEEACRVLEREGATVQQVELPDFTTFRAIMWVVTGAEFAGCLRPLLRRSAPELHPWTRVLLERSEFVPATEYIHAQRVRARLAADVRAALAGFDALALPAVPIPAFPIDKPPFVEVEGVREEPLSMSVRYTAAFNCTGHPAVTVPCGFTSAGLPIGLQVVGRSFDEATVLRVAHTYERATGWHEERPPGARQAHAAA
jgi:aspartyl-tRNA(Asn)/glutamyl-tRNA(Gln) amidotransferase subunit A